MCCTLATTHLQRHEAGRRLSTLCRLYNYIHNRFTHLMCGEFDSQRKRPFRAWSSAVQLLVKQLEDKEYHSDHTCI